MIRMEVQMDSERVSDLTMHELRKLIGEAVDERLQTWPRPYDARSTQAVLQSIDKNIWTPPPGSPSTLELLREDRDR